MPVKKVWPVFYLAAKKLRLPAFWIRPPAAAATLALSFAACGNEAAQAFSEGPKNKPEGGIRQEQAAQLVTRLGTFDVQREELPSLTKVKVAPLKDRLPYQPAPLVGEHVGYVAVFAAPIDETVRQSLAEQKLRIRSYVPDNALWLEGDDDAVARLRRRGDLVGLVAIPEVLKLDPRLVERQSARRLSVIKPIILPWQDVIIELDAPTSRPAVEAAVGEFGGTVVHEGVDVLQRRADDAHDAGALAEDANDHVGTLRSIHAHLPPQSLVTFGDMPAVLAIMPFIENHLLNDRSYGIVQSGNLNERPVWQMGLRGQGQIIAVADTGVHRSSCFFSRSDKIIDYQDWAGNNDGDAAGHGTHVAGSIAGNSAADGFYHRHDGMAPAAQLIVQDMAEGDRLIGLDRELTPVFKSAYQSRARIHSDSWGDEDNTYTLDARSIDRFVNKHRDFLVVVANGNSGELGEGTVGSPATAKNIIAVGAIDGANKDHVAHFSSRGPTFDGRIKPALMAPGVSIVSARHVGACSTRVMSGTSMATPILAGAAALVRQYFTEGRYPTGVATTKDAFVPTAALLKAVLLAGAETLQANTGSVPSAMEQGFGRMRLDRTLRVPPQKERLFVLDESFGLDTGHAITLSFDVAAGGALDVALTWTDPAAFTNAAKVLVNDLDLEVLGPQLHLVGNHFVNEEDEDVADFDRLNVEEVVHYAQAAAGRYQVFVRGHRVALGKQTFALSINARLEGEVEAALVYP